MTRSRNPDFTYLPDRRGILKAHVLIKCETCGNEALARADGSRRFCSKRCAVLKQHADGKSRQVSGAEHYNWKGSAAKYQAMHNRVMHARGRADHCEWRDTVGCSSIAYEWAHLHETDPGDPQNYVSLCKPCHQSYDGQVGETHASAKLTDDQIAEIRRRYAAGDISQQSLANEFGIHQASISKIVLGQVRLR